MRIFIDIDDTITNFAEVLLENLNEKYNTNYTIYDLTNWNCIRTFFEEPWSVMTPWFWREVKVAPEAKEFIKKRLEKGDEIYIATATFIDESLPAKIDTTLNQLDNMIDKDHIIITRNKNILCGDIMIDDGIHNLINNQCKLNFCFSQPWNWSSLCIQNSIIRTKDWDRISDIIDKFFN